MKQTFLTLLLVCALVFTSCKNDDDAENNCQTCDLEILGENLTSEYCDNGDGTVTVTTDGQSQTTSLNGVSYDQFISTLEQAGATCN